jgi:transglutaminase-like putative cysteine protease
MKLHVFHKTRYDYDNPVELNTHSIFLKPLQRSYLKVENYQMEIQPDPEGLVERFSIEGNPFYQTWFTGLANKLEVKTSFDVLIEPFNPFSFIIDLEFVENINPSLDKFFRYDSMEEILLFAYLLTEIDAPLRDFANEEFFKYQDNPLGYLMALTAAIHSNWQHIIREEENLWSPESTYLKREGSCRDLSWMLIHMLRMQGLAARFVSGYAYNPNMEEGHELHAWVEVYLPGAGWIGIDPSLGLFADENYIPLACSSDAQNTLPVHGNYAGAAKAKLTTLVEIHKS